MGEGQRVAVVGAGRMGGAMVGTLRRAGVEVVVFNRTRPKAEAVAEATGAVVAASAREAVEGAQVVLSSLADDAAVGAAYTGGDGIVAGLQPGTVVCESSTIDPGTLHRLRPLVEARRASLLDTPVSGSVSTVEAGQLTIMAGGDPEVLERARPALDPLAKQIFHVGGLGSGAVMKLAVNSILHGLNLALPRAWSWPSGPGWPARPPTRCSRPAPSPPPSSTTSGRPSSTPAGLRSPSASTWSPKDLELVLDLAAGRRPHGAGGHQPWGGPGRRRRRPRRARPQRADHLPPLRPGQRRSGRGPYRAVGRSWSMSRVDLSSSTTGRRVLEALAGDLERRFGASRRVVRRASTVAAVEALKGLARRGEEVALVVAGQQMAELPGVLLLLRGPRLLGAERVLLVGRRSGRPPTRRAGRDPWADRRLPVRAVAAGRALPVLQVSQVLADWTPSRDLSSRGSGSSGRAGRRAPMSCGHTDPHGIPTAGTRPDSAAGRELLEEAGQDGSPCRW